MTDTKLDKLFRALDDEAVAMLGAIKKASAADIGEEGIPEVTFAERARVFAEVSKYALDRAKALPPPPPKTKGKFSDLKDRFHGNEAPSGARVAKPRKPNLKAV